MCDRLLGVNSMGNSSRKSTRVEWLRQAGGCHDHGKIHNMQPYRRMGGQHRHLPAADCRYQITPWGRARSGQIGIGEHALHNQIQINTEQ